MAHAEAVRERGLARHVEGLVLVVLLLERRDHARIARDERAAARAAQPARAGERRRRRRHAARSRRAEVRIPRARIDGAAAAGRRTRRRRTPRRASGHPCGTRGQVGAARRPRLREGAAPPLTPMRAYASSMLVSSDAPPSVASTDGGCRGCAPTRGASTRRPSPTRPAAADPRGELLRARLRVEACGAAGWRSTTAAQHPSARRRACRGRSRKEVEAADAHHTAAARPEVAALASSFRCGHVLVSEDGLGRGGVGERRARRQARLRRWDGDGDGAALVGRPVDLRGRRRQRVPDAQLGLQVATPPVLLRKPGLPGAR